MRSALFLNSIQHAERLIFNSHSMNIHGFDRTYFKIVL